jgi:hypothetical protein
LEQRRTSAAPDLAAAVHSGMVPSSDIRRRPWEPVVAAAYGLLALIALLRWGGTPRVDAWVFVLGAVSVTATLAGLAALGWFLMVRPVRGAMASSPPILTVTTRRGLALLLATSGLLIAVGGYWDEVWHRSYGLPFGADLFWRPHLLMYAGLLAVLGVATASAWLLVRRGSGGWRARFRSNPTLGWLVLLGGFLAYALPADPAWHALYGADITAWSLPHLVLLVTFSAIMLSAAAIHLSTLPRRHWHGPLRFRADAALAVVGLASALLLATQLLTMEWDGITRLRLGSAHPFWQRPEWLLPVVVVAVAAFFGTFALRATRFVGAATLVGVVALALRAALVGAFDAPSMSVNAYLLSLPPLLALDLAYAVGLARRASPPTALPAALAATAGLALGSLPLLAALYLYPRVTLETVPPMLAVGALSALWACWLGTRLGERFGPSVAATQVEVPGRVPWPSYLVLTGAVGFMAWFIVTATPPA